MGKARNKRFRANKNQTNIQPNTNKQTNKQPNTQTAKQATNQPTNTSKTTKQGVPEPDQDQAPEQELCHEQEHLLTEWTFQALNKIRLSLDCLKTNKKALNILKIASKENLS